MSHGRIGGGAEAPSGRKARRAAWEMRLGVTIRIGVAEETGVVDVEEGGSVGIAGDGALGTAVDGASVTDVGDDGLTGVGVEGPDVDGTSRVGSGGKSSSVKIEVGAISDGENGITVAGCGGRLVVADAVEV